MEFNKIIDWLKLNPFYRDLFEFVGILILSYVAYVITRKVIIRGLQKLVSKTKTKIDDLFLNEKLLRRISYLAPLWVIHEFLYLVPQTADFFRRIISALTILIILLIIVEIVASFNLIYEKFEGKTKKSIKGYLQIINIIIYIMGAIIILGVLTGQNPWTLLTGIGALTAIILLIFKDTILSFVASIQISSYDLIRIGDWIEVPSLGVDGDVMDLALHTIKVRNFDKTITVIPTFKLIDVSFKNWRGMVETGGRRIKRAVYIDQSSVRFADEQLLKRFENFQLIADYIKSKREEVAKFNKDKNINDNDLINGRRLTNLGTFQAYLKAYLRQREDINKNLTFLIRQLPPGPNGLPIEIYVFASTTDWGKFEEIQADIFDHVLAVIPQFDLRIFQNPTGADFKELKK